MALTVGAIRTARRKGLGRRRAKRGSRQAYSKEKKQKKVEGEKIAPCNDYESTLKKQCHTDDDR